MRSARHWPIDPSTVPESNQVRHFAARLDDVPAEDVGRYPKLTSLDAPTPPPARRVVKKQVDKKWVAQRGRWGGGGGVRWPGCLVVGRGTLP